MAFNQILNTLISTNELESKLKRGAKNSDVKELQKALHEMGFDNELKWARFGADGDFGGGTSTALQAFAQKNNVPFDGKTVTPTLGLKVLEGQELVADLKALYVANFKKQLAAQYPLSNQNATGTKGLASLLKALNFSQTPVSAALKAFDQSNNMSSDGSQLTADLAQAIIKQTSRFFGSSWDAGLIDTSPSAGLTLKDTGRGFDVSEGPLSIFLKRYSKGLFTRGTHTIEQFVKAQATAIQQIGLSNSEINVMRSVAENEGNFDAINTYDSNYLSMGIFQWTLGMSGDTGELPALLKKIKEDQPELFMQYLGQFGIDVSSGTNSTYGYLTLNGKLVNSAGSKKQFRGAPWAFRFWAMGQNPALQAVELRHAVGRLKNFYWKQSYSINGFTISKIITSEYGVALILDNHVNRPGYVKPCIQKAMQKVGLNNPTNWTTADEEKVLNAYLKIRQTYGSSPMTDALKRGNTTKKYVNKGIISADRGSFQSSEAPTTRTRSLEVPNHVPEPVGYQEKHFPDIAHVKREKAPK